MRRRPPAFTLFARYAEEVKWVCLFLLVAAAAPGANLTLPCVQDTFVDSAEPTQAKGRDRELWVKGKQQITLLRFPWNTVTGWSIQRATLVLRTSESFAPNKLAVVVVPQEWKETEATYEEASAQQPWPGKKPSLREVLPKKLAYTRVKEREQEMNVVELPLDRRTVEELRRTNGTLALVGSLLQEAVAFRSREASGGPQLVIEGAPQE